MAKNCANCAAYNTMSQECRRNAPQGMLIMNPRGEPQVVGFWPLSKAEHWCLQHVVAEGETAEKPAALVSVA